MAIQNNVKRLILTQLLKSEKLRYGDMHPDNVDNDLFNYHLQDLVKLGLVEKEDKLYSLSALGRHELAENNPMALDGTSVDRFKINVLTIVLKREGNELQVLMQRRKKHPFYNTVAVMGGVVNKGELLQEAASARLQAKTGLEGQFSLCGLWRNISYDQTGVLILEDILFHICCTDQYTGELLAVTESGENFWLSIDEAIQAHENHPGTFRMLAPFLKRLRQEDFHTMPLFYWEHQGKVSTF